jgi:hypothetical protein
MKRLFVPAALVFGLSIGYLLGNSNKTDAEQQQANDAPRTPLILWHSPANGEPQSAMDLEIASYSNGREFIRVRPVPEDTSKVWTFVGPGGRVEIYADVTR